MQETIRNSVVETIRNTAELFDTHKQAVIGTEVSGRIVYWNRAAERLYGWTSAEVLGRDIVDVTPASPSQEQARAIMERMRTGRSWSGNFLVRDRAGHEFEAHVRDIPVENARGDLVGVVGVSVRAPAG